MREQWDELKEIIIELRDNNGTSTQQEVCQFLANLMNVLEAQMEPERKRGKWIDAWRCGMDGTKHWHRECSECGYERDDDDPDKDTKFCPNCGWEMENGRWMI